MIKDFRMNLVWLCIESRKVSMYWSHAQFVRGSKIIVNYVIRAHFRLFLTLFETFSYLTILFPWLARGRLGPCWPFFKHHQGVELGSTENDSMQLSGQSGTWTCYVSRVCCSLFPQIPRLNHSTCLGIINSSNCYTGRKWRKRWLTTCVLRCTLPYFVNDRHFSTTHVSQGRISRYF